MTTPSLTDSECLAGMVERVTFHSEGNGFCVLRVAVPGQRDLVTVIGSAASVTAGEHLEASGHWVNDQEYGRQFRCTALRLVAPSSLEGIERYLGSGMVKGIGKRCARHLVEAFGAEVFQVIEDAPERLLDLHGIGPKRQARITNGWAEQKVIHAIMVFLHTHGVGSSRAVRIYKTYGNDAVARVRENPYGLALDIEGIGFKTADGIASRLGIAPDAPMRAQAGVRHVLQEWCGHGHCAAWYRKVAADTVALLAIPEPVVEAAIQVELDEERLIAEEINGKPVLFLAALQRAERGVTGHLRRLAVGGPPWALIDSGKALPWAEQHTGQALSASQRRAVTTALNAKIAIITGGPGVGKTTVVNSILGILTANGVEERLAAPTGRAAKRLAESTGREAKTIHRLLEFDARQMAFTRNAEHPLDADLVVIDEASMVDVVLMNQLLKAIPDSAALLLVGDVDQLPSVGPGAVLADVIAAEVVPVIRLTEIFRQAAHSRIVVNAHRINAGTHPEGAPPGEPDSDFHLITAKDKDDVHDRLLRVVAERIPARYGLDPVRDVQILTPMNSGVLGSRALNADLQALLNPDAQPCITRFGWTYAPGDMVIQLANDYDKEVFNGDIGRVQAIDTDEGLLTIDFDGRVVTYEASELDTLALAYATSVHKAQGSEYPAVVIPLAMEHYTLLQRNLLYTAVTRGKKVVVVIAEPKALSIAVKRTDSQRRLTRLRERLRGPNLGLTLAWH